ncbi:hypothetical protein [Psychrobacter pygoscelis]|uniref:hypothetical protein n=1 Tax=Psychrobacter pygoscelis TaxID=2488563 RepID=UPI00103A05BB|nr:hypothetical protein [Psychrobacter pygoscelis]
MKDKIIVKILLDYGAEEYIWHTPFQSIVDLVQWWRSIESIDISNDNIREIINIGQLKKIILNKDVDDIPEVSIEKSPRIMLDNDYSSYLFYDGKQYYHRGKRFLETDT